MSDFGKSVDEATGASVRGPATPPKPRSVPLRWHPARAQPDLRAALTQGDIAALANCEPYSPPVPYSQVGNPGTGQVTGRIVPEWLVIRLLAALTCPQEPKP